jgi:hypothetical protein
MWHADKQQRAQRFRRALLRAATCAAPHLHHAAQLTQVLLHLAGLSQQPDLQLDHGDGLGAVGQGAQQGQHSPEAGDVGSPQGKQSDERVHTAGDASAGEPLRVCYSCGAWCGPHALGRELAPAGRRGSRRSG